MEVISFNRGIGINRQEHAGFQWHRRRPGRPIVFICAMGQVGSSFHVTRGQHPGKPDRQFGLRLWAPLVP